MEDEQEDQSQKQQHNPILSDGKLKIKLKINPKNLEDEIVRDFYQDEDDYDDHQIISPVLNNTDTKQNNNNNNPRVCSECYKEFSSGKALGGHMRIHAQALKKKQHDNHQLNQNTMMFKKHGKSSEEDSIVFDLDKNKKKHDYGDDFRKPICSLCGKNFPSMKSLFGHMRCHPEREWRGIQPPKQFEKINTSFSSSSLSHDEEEFNDGGGGGDEAAPVVDLAHTLVPWSVKARRGRKGIRGSSAAASSSEFSGSEDEEEEEEEEEKLRNAVNDLLMLKQLVTFEATNSNSVTNNNEIDQDSNRVFEESKKKKKNKKNKKKRRLIEEEVEEYPVEADDDDDYYPVMKKLRIEKNGGDNTTEKGKGKAVFVENHAPLLDKECCSDGGQESDSRNTELMAMNQNNKYFDGKFDKNKKKVKKMKLMMDLDSLQEHEKPEYEPEKYKCSTCNKCFPSHQALGGHKSSHNKFKITIIDQNHQQHQHQASSAAVVPDHHHQEFGQQQFEQPHHHQQQQQQANTDEELTNKEISSDNTVHQCRICNKTFPSGQALGGHKRCHWAGPVPELAAPLADQAQLAQAPSRQFTSSGEEASQNAGSSRQMMEFDLNELPPMEDYDVENAAAAAAETGYSYGYC